MSIIVSSNISSSKNIELVDLEAHVILCEERRQTLEDKIIRVERDLKTISDEAVANRRLFTVSMLSIISGIISTIISVSMRYHS
jgi:hypothetical protein